MKNDLTPPEGERVITTASVTAWLDNEGYVIMLAKGNQTLENAKENMKAVIELASGRHIPLLIDYTNILSISREARLFYGSYENAEIVAACAILITSLIGTMIANFEIGLSKAVAPVRLFTNVSEAKKWLKHFIWDDIK